MIEPVFRARQAPQSVPSDTSETLRESQRLSQATPIELSKNAHFCLSRLPANPAFLNNTGAFSNAYADGRSQFALAVDSNSIVAWPYSSTDSQPLSIQFPLVSKSLTPLAILTLPSSPASSDPGLITIDSLQGKAIFYDSISHAPALGLINNRLLETTIPLNVEQGEYITMAENVEPAGVAVATSWKRCILISLRDFQNGPLLQCIELRSSSTSNGLLRRLFFGGHSETPEIGDEIVSIKTASITGRGVSQDLVIMDSAGRFDFVTYHLTSATGNPHVEHRKSFLHSLKYLLEASFDSIDSPDITFLDLWPLPGNSCKYATLVHAGKSGVRGQLVVATLHIDQTGVLVHGQHRLAKYEETQLISLANKPRLFMPGPGTAAFVAFDNCVLVSDIDTSYISEKSTVALYKPRWEDIIRLRPLVEIIGYGYETEQQDRNPAIIILTKGSGVMRLEKFATNAGSPSNEALPTTLPLEMLKSRIELGVFYADSQELDLDIKNELADNEVQNAVSRIRSQICNLKSPYLNVRFPLVSDSLAARTQLLEKLYLYCERNFPILFKSQLANPIAESWEQLGVCQQLWKVVDNSSNLKPTLDTVLRGLGNINQDQKDVVRVFFDDHTSMIGDVLVAFVDELLASNANAAIIADLITDCIYQGIYGNLSKHSGLKEMGSRKWLRLPALLSLADDAFAKVYEQVDCAITLDSTKNQLVRMVKCLCFLARDVDQSLEYAAVSESRAEHVKWHRRRAISWMNVLLLQCLEDSGRECAEFMGDFFALSHLFETSRARLEAEAGYTLNNLYDDDDDYAELMKEFHRCFETYGYAFAKQLYDYYTLRELVQPLLLDFTNYKHHLNRYLAENSDQTASFAWIRYVFDNQYACAAHSLVRAGHDTQSAVALELSFALAKVASLAAGCSPQTEEALLESEHALAELRAQRNMYNSLCTAVGVPEAITWEKFMDTVVNSAVDPSMGESLLRPGYDAFVHQKVLDFATLVNYLTLINPTVCHRAYADALKLATSLVNESEASLWTKIIWLRIIVLSGEWSDQNTSNMTDDQKRKFMRELLLYSALGQVGLDSPALASLLSLATDREAFAKEVSDYNHNAIRDSTLQLLETFSHFQDTHDFEVWINSISYDIKQNSSCDGSATFKITV